MTRRQRAFHAAIWPFLAAGLIALTAVALFGRAHTEAAVEAVRSEGPR